MKFIKFSYVLSLLTFLNCCGSSSDLAKEEVLVENGKIDLSLKNFSNGETYKLEGKYKFLWKEFVQADSEAGFDSIENNRDSFHQISVPGEWNDPSIIDIPIEALGYATYFVSVKLNPGETNLAFKTPIVYSAFTLWINGNKILEIGNPGMSKETTNPSQYSKIIRIDPKLYSSDGMLDMVIHVANFHNRRGGMFNSFIIGDYDSMMDEKIKNLIYDVFLLGIIIIMGFYHLIMYFYRRKDKSTLYFGLYCIFISGRVLLLGDKLLEEYFPNLHLLFLFLEYTFLIFSLLAFTNFLYHLFHKYFSIFILKLINWLGIAFLIPILLFPAYYYTKTIIAIQIFILICAIYCTFLLIYSSIRKHEGAGLFLFSWFVLFFTVVHDILVSSMIINSNEILHYGLVFFIFSQSAVLAKRFASSFARTEDLIRELDACFIQFDKITSRYGLEKLKTIGDSYMCASGIPTTPDTPNPILTNSLRAVLAGIEIQNFMTTMKELKSNLNIPYWELRVGIHTGPLVAGVIGEKKFAYDVWGDTVNTASRMESTGTEGRINISEATYEIIKDFMTCEYRGKINAKNKGEITMYYVNSIQPNFAKDEEGKILTKNY